MLTLVARQLNKSCRLFSSATALTSSDLVDGIQTITLNNVKKRNALSLAMLTSLENDLRKHALDSQARVIILKSTGHVFSAGHDLKELTTENGFSHQEKVFKKCSEVMRLIQELPLPVIAQVNGLATAAGCQLVATCDLAIVSSKSAFATPGVKVGLFCSTPAVAVVRSVPNKTAMKMLLTGEPISAQEALQAGLVSHVVDESELEDKTLLLANQISQYSRSVLALGKTIFYRQSQLGVDAAYSVAGAAMLENLQLKDCQEGIRSFAAKDKPLWKHNFDKVIP